MKIFNCKVFGLEESILASGYPMSTKVRHYGDEHQFYYSPVVNPSDVNRAKRLGKYQPGAGHDCYLKGVRVQADVLAPQYWWQQFQRYHFADIISSQSKMHRIHKMDVAKQCNKYVLPATIGLMNRLVEEYNDVLIHQHSDLEIQNALAKERFMTLVSNCPMGLELTARIDTNYLQLKTIYNQRKAHKLEEWTDVFVPWMMGLPYFRVLIGLDKEGGEA